MSPKTNLPWKRTETVIKDEKADSTILLKCWGDNPLRESPHLVPGNRTTFKNIEEDIFKEIPFGTVTRMTTVQVSLTQQKTNFSCWGRTIAVFRVNTNFADTALKSVIFREIAVIPWTPFVGEFFAKSAHLSSRWQETIFREICSGPVCLTWSETYFRQDQFPSYLFSRRQFHAIVTFRLKSSSDLESGSLPGLYGESMYAKLKILLL